MIDTATLLAAQLALTQREKLCTRDGISPAVWTQAKRRIQAEIIHRQIEAINAEIPMFLRKQAG